MRAEDLVKAAKEASDRREAEKARAVEADNKEAMLWIQENKDKAVKDAITYFLRSDHPSKHQISPPTPLASKLLVDVFVDLGYKALVKEERCPMSGWTTYDVVVYNPIKEK